MPAHSVRRATWDQLTTDDLYGIVRLRVRVFGLEQRVTAEDFDGRDREPDTEHWWVPGPGGDAVGYLRLIRPAPDEAHPAGATAPAWVIGRVATDVPYRGTGIARALVSTALEAHADDAIVLHAQEQAAGMYAAHGFVPFGEPYVEAGIRHVGMHRG